MKREANPGATDGDCGLEKREKPTEEGSWQPWRDGAKIMWNFKPPFVSWEMGYVCHLILQKRISRLTWRARIFSGKCSPSCTRFHQMKPSYETFTSLSLYFKSYRISCRALVPTSSERCPFPDVSSLDARDCIVLKCEHFQILAVTPRQTKLTSLNLVECDGFK